jgi:hypothetical protein
MGREYEFDYDESEYLLKVELPSEWPDEIRVMLNVPDQNTRIKKIRVVLSSDEVMAADRIGDPINPFRKITYFKILDESDNPVTKFNPPLRIRLTYTPEAWEKFMDSDAWKEHGRPKVYYQPYKGGNWVDWVDFDKDKNCQVEVVEPDPEPYGFIRIHASELPDPRIGGC